MGTQQFDQLIGELPPSTVDVTGIIRHEKRRSAVRRFAGLAGVVVTLSVTTALGLTMTGGTGASSPPSVAGGASTPYSATPDTRFALVAKNEQTGAASAKRLSTALDAAFKKEAVGATWIFEPQSPHETGPDGQPPTVRYRQAASASTALELFAGDGGVLHNGRKGSLHLGISPANGVGEDGVNHHGTVACPSVPQDWRGCKAGVAASGVKTILMTWTDRGGSVASVLLPDQRILHLGITKAFGVDGAGASQDAAPLTGDQVLAIAVDVAGQIKA